MEVFEIPDTTLSFKAGETEGEIDFIEAQLVIDDTYKTEISHADRLVIIQDWLASKGIAIEKLGYVYALMVKISDAFTEHKKKLDESLTFPTTSESTPETSTSEPSIP